MSSAQRAAAEKLRQRYAKHFGVALGDVTIEWHMDEDATIKASGHPEWTTGSMVKSRG